MSRAYSYMIRLTIALLTYRQLQEALYHAFDCPDEEDDDRFDSANIEDRLKQHVRIIRLDEGLAS